MMDTDTEPPMLSEKLLSEAIREFLEYSLHESEQIRHKDYEIYQWTDDGRMAATNTVVVPSARGWAENQPGEVTKIGVLIEELVSDDDISLIKSQTGALKAFNRLIEEIRIETNRGETEDLRNNPDFLDAIHSDEASIEFVAPIVGLYFEGDIRITDNLVIRRLSNFEKELMLNTDALGGGSVVLRRAVQIGNLTHAAVYKKTATVEEGWEGGIGIMTEIDQEVRDVLENLKVALRLIHPEGFQMSVRYIVDSTFYPSVITAHEMHGSISPGGIAEPELADNGDKLVEYYQLVSRANEDEGLRVAIERLESSYRKISNADGIVDAVIGIEALLSSGRNGSFQEVRRRAAILSGEKSTYSELGHLQSLRNATVHGEETQVDQEDLQQARNLVAVLLDRVITITNEKDIKRADVIDILDAAITDTVENRFDELLSEYKSIK